MNRSHNKFLSLMICFMLLVTIVTVTPVHAEPLIKDLFTLIGEESNVYAINTRGQVVGVSISPDGYPNAIMWENGEIKNLGTLGGSYSIGLEINDNCQIVGSSTMSQIDEVSGTIYEVTHPFLWENGTMKDLGSLGGNYSTAYDINNKGQVVGLSAISSEITYAFIWENGVMKDLDTLGGSYSQASGINDKDQVVGYSNTSANRSSHACMWENGLIKDLGTLGGADSDASAINEKGQIVGSSTTTDNYTHAFIWENGVMKDLGTLGGGYSYAFDINNIGQVVGVSLTADGYTHAFIWENGVMKDLGHLGGFNSYAFGINDKGQVVGHSYSADGENHAVLWDDPVPTSPTNTPTNTPTSTPTNTPTSTNTAIATPTYTPTSTPTNIPTYTPTSTPTNTPTITPTSPTIEVSKVVFGPKTYIRKTGKPHECINDFTISDTRGKFFIVIESSDKNIIIKLNGKIIVKKMDNQKIIVPVNIKSKNKISVELRGKPNTYAVVAIHQISTITTNKNTR